METQIAIRGGTCLLPDGNDASDWNESDIAVRGSRIEFIGFKNRHSNDARQITFDASGLLVLPGMIDIHGDAFERQIQPRPKTVFSHDIALTDTDRQLIANGITTACHGVTYSWEGGLRGREAAMMLMDQVARRRELLHADHRIHLRFENHHAAGVQDALDWIAQGRIDFFAFNEHLPSIVAKAASPDKLASYAERARCTSEEFRQRIADALRRSGDVPESVERLAAACREHGIPMASHDDETWTDREHYQALGVEISEFPRTQDALFTAMALSNRVIMGAPNVLLAGSHCGGLAAADTIKSGMCDILASDYYYPALLHAPFRLTHMGTCSLAQAWRLVSANPAQALNLSDRGRIEPGLRADLIAVEPCPSGSVRLVATIAGGKLAYCAEPDRLVRTPDYSMAA
ncbi:MAG: alpha-D-ribose 1-methylphosphonate 5-triphosphate diphosphatase [Burkholderiales bacterium]|nr:alpha-D-ribose 1-methylphosphonate 5-triphosphate diphosphatase [Burkholderiales bacterium]